MLPDELKTIVGDKGWSDDPEIVEGMNGHICRCNGYPKIVHAVRRAAENRKG